MTIPSSTPSPQPLDYGKAPSPGCKRVIRVAVVVVLLSVGLVALKWAGVAWRQGQILYYQRQCLNYTAPADQVVYEEEPNAAATLLTSRAGYAVYTVSRVDAKQKFLGNGAQPPWPLVPMRAVKAAAYAPRCWQAIEKSGFIAPGPAWLRQSVAICFLHQRVSPSGNNRLVPVRYYAQGDPIGVEFVAGHNYEAEPVVPATLMQGPKVCSLGSIGTIRGVQPRQPMQLRIYAGQADPKDASHFTIRYRMWGQEDVLDGYLKDDDTVTLTARNPPKEP